jgi:hypothetical protein
MTTAQEKSEARAKLEAAIQEFVSSTASEGDGGLLVTGYAIVAHAVVPARPGWSAYKYLVPETQPTHVTRGLVDMLDDAARECVTRVPRAGL